MLIRKIELINFRQFSGKKTIEFSTDEEKNVTVILGDNGAGKTTMAQAFLWALYGQTDFKVKELINRDVRDAMRPYDEEYVRVDLYISKDNKEYLVSRRQKILREYKSFKEHNVEFVVGEKNNLGEWNYKNEIASMSFVKQLLPFELSKFFFFDGERIKKMSDEIESGRSKEFADAVRGLVGLTAMMNAIAHFKPSTTNSTVIGRYTKAIDDSGNVKLSDYTKRIAIMQSRVDFLQKRNGEIEPEIDRYVELAVLKKNEYLSLTPAIQLKQKYDELNKGIDILERNKTEAVNAFIKMFSDRTSSFFATALIKNSLTELKDSSKLDKGIPKLHADTIKFLLERGFCICGNELLAGSDGAKKLYELIDIVPPKNLGQSIGEYASVAREKTRSSANFYELFVSAFKRIREISDKIESQVIARDEIYNSLSDTSKAQTLRTQQQEYEATANRLKAELRTNQDEIALKQKDIKYLEAEKEKLVLLDEKNRGNRILLEYAKYIYEELSAQYTAREDEVRNKLQDYINNIFSTIYDDGIRLEVDEKYNIKVTVTDTTATGDELERNTAQNYAIIFAFISGIIKMAKEKNKESFFETESEESVCDDTDGYPLVMDAPLSAFDKTRIHNICDTIPAIAQQVIIFIKDTDGEVAEEHMGNKIGTKWLLTAETKTETIIDRRP